MYEIKVKSTTNTITVKQVSQTINLSTTRGAIGATGATGPQGPAGSQGDPGQGVPTGGTAGQSIVKDSGTDFDTSWQTIDKAFVGLGAADNTSDADKPVSDDTQAALDLKENVSNKSTSTSLGTSDTLYPSQKAVKVYVDTAIDGVESGDVDSFNGRTGVVVPVSGDYTAALITNTPAGSVAATTVQAAIDELDAEKESLSNKSTGTSLGTSNSLYPSQNAVKVYVDNSISSAGALYLTKASNLSDLSSAAAARTNLGLVSGGAGDIWVKKTGDTMSGSLIVTGTATASNLSGTNTGDQTATTVPNTPSGSIASTNVQDAINELDTEKAAASSLGDYVLKSGDTMSGTLTTTGALVASGNFSAATTTVGVYLGMPTALSPRITIATGTAGETRAIDATGGLMRIVNSSASTILATINSTGGVQLAPPASTTSATHTLTLGSTATGMSQYNTSDQTTNYERVRSFWSSNVYNVTSEVGGSGTLRGIRISCFSTSGLSVNNTSATGFVQSIGVSSSASAIIHNFTGTLSSSSGTQFGIQLAPTISQTSTAGYTALDVNVTESGTGSGAKLLANLRVGGSSKFSVSNTGLMSSALSQAYTVTNPNALRSIDVSAINLADLARVVGTMITDLKALGLMT